MKKTILVISTTILLSACSNHDQRYDSKKIDNNTITATSINRSGAISGSTHYTIKNDDEQQFSNFVQNIH